MGDSFGALPHRTDRVMSEGMDSRAIFMPRHPARRGWLSLCMAFLALFGCAMLNAWHEATPHIDQVVGFTVADHHDGRDHKQTDGSVDLHLGAHSIVGSLASVESSPPVADTQPFERLTWPAFADANESGFGSDRLLRPPRA
jgi:hypothetical protein